MENEIKIIRHYGNDVRALREAIHIFVTAPLNPSANCPSPSLAPLTEVSGNDNSNGNTPPTKRRNARRSKSPKSTAEAASAAQTPEIARETAHATL